MGFRHALEADHLLAVATLSESSHSGKAMVQGITWGIGHTTTLAIAGAAVLYFDFVIVDELSLILELFVGIMLIFLGADLARKIIVGRLHVHVHCHSDGVKHLHLHSHRHQKSNETALHDHGHSTQFPVRALLIGMMHGMAGSSVLILLTLKTIQSPALGFVYIILFGVGSIISMAMVSIAISVPMKVSLGKSNWLYGGLRTTIATTTLIMGGYIVYETAFNGGLITL